MDATQFDQLVKTLARTGDRRGALRAMGAAGMAVLAALGVADVAAAKKNGTGGRHRNNNEPDHRHDKHHGQRHDRQRDGKDTAGAEKKKKKCKNGLQKCKLSKRKRICVNFQTDTANCGGCGVRCDGAQTCSGGVCQTAPSPPPGPLPPPPEACANPGTCSNRPKCGPEGTTCSCGTTVEGEAFCTSGGGCGSLPPCTATSECAGGSACSLGCCSSPVCIPPCAPVCKPDPPGTTCAGKECGPVTNNCGDEVSCGHCPAFQFCDHGSCEPEPLLICQGCGNCQHATVADGSVGSCSQSCLDMSLCTAAVADSYFGRLNTALLQRGFKPSGQAYAVELDEVDDVPDASVLIFPFTNSDTGDTAGLSYGLASTSNQPILIAVIGDADQVPYKALAIDNGVVVEVEAAGASSAARGQRHSRQHDVAAASAPPLTCRRCSTYCRWGSNLGGIGVGACLAIVAIAATGIGAVALAIAAAAFAIGGFVAGEFCPNWCGCLYCFCTDTCYNDTTSCQAVCKPSLGCNTGICAPAQPGDC